MMARASGPSHLARLDLASSGRAVRSRGATSWRLDYRGARPRIRVHDGPFARTTKRVASIIQFAFGVEVKDSDHELARAMEAAARRAPQAMPEERGRADGLQRRR
jgi:hypothetical protein